MNTSCEPFRIVDTLAKMLFLLLILFEPPALSYNTSEVVHKAVIREVGSPNTDTNDIKESILHKINEYSSLTGNQNEQLESIENALVGDTTKNMAETASSPEDNHLQASDLLTNMIADLKPTDTELRYLTGQETAATPEKSKTLLPISIKIQQASSDNKGSDKPAGDWRKKFFKVILK